LLADDNVAACSLAVSAPIHLQLLNQVAAPGRAKIEKTLALDLTKEAPAELIERFQREG
jgi:hypothetical protein